MAEILRQGPTCDGYDVRILVDGAAKTLHFLTQPADVAAAVADILQAHEDARLVFVVNGEAD